MRGVKILGVRKVETRDYPEPVPQGDEVVVRLEAAALCGSDLHGLYETPGEKGWIPGHEGAGVVVAVARPGLFRVGDRVCATAMYACGVCDRCRGGHVIYCRRPKGIYGFGLDGFQAEYVRISERALVAIPDWMTFEQACVIPDPVATAYHASKRMGLSASHVVGVFGLGPMGLGAVCVAAHLGARVVAVDPIRFRRNLARKLGAAEVVDPAKGDVVEQVRDRTGGHGLDRAFECSGKAGPLYAALDLLTHFGHLALIGENQEAKVNPSNHFLRKELTMSGSTCAPLGEFEEVVRLFEAGLPAAEMITHRFTLDQAAKAYATFAAGNTGKVIFVPRRSRRTRA